MSACNPRRNSLSCSCMRVAAPSASTTPPVCLLGRDSAPCCNSSASTSIRAGAPITPWVRASVRTASGYRRRATGLARHDDRLAGQGFAFLQPGAMSSTANTPANHPPIDWRTPSEPDRTSSSSGLAPAGAGESVRCGRVRFKHEREQTWRRISGPRARPASLQDARRRAVRANRLERQFPARLNRQFAPKAATGGPDRNVRAIRPVGPGSGSCSATAPGRRGARAQLGAVALRLALFVERAETLVGHPEMPPGLRLTRATLRPAPRRRQGALRPAKRRGIGPDGPGLLLRSAFAVPQMHPARDGHC